MQAKLPDYKSSATLREVLNMLQHNLTLYLVDEVSEITSFVKVFFSNFFEGYKRNRQYDIL